jgi:nitrous oxide reductase accessory protein NosL
MRSTLTAALAAGVLLAGCGSTTSTPAPVESESASGAVAGTVADCKEGPPAELFKAKTYSHDGVVGTMRNTGPRISSSP